MKKKRKEIEWTRTVENRKEEIPGRGRSMHGYILIYSRFYRGNLWQLWVLKRGDLNFCVCSIPAAEGGGEREISISASIGPQLRKGRGNKTERTMIIIITWKMTMITSQTADRFVNLLHQNPPLASLRVCNKILHPSLPFLHANVAKPMHQQQQNKTNK